VDHFADTAQFPVWHAANVSPPRCSPAPSHSEVDVAIVGGGFSGLWTAYYLLKAQPQLRVALFESRNVGFGASGRNGGWCSGFFPLSVAELATVYGPDAAQLAYRESFATLAEMSRVISEERIECGWHVGGTLQSASTSLQAHRLQTNLAQQHQAGLSTNDALWLSASEVGKHIAVAETHGAIYSPHCATVNPFQLVHGLANSAQALGATIWEHSKVLSINDGIVTHEHGRCRAQLVVQATEGYSHALRQTRRRIVPLYSLMVATEPLDAATVEQLHWHGRSTFNDGSNMVIYAQLTADNRIAFGGRGAPYHYGSRIREQYDIHDQTHELIVKSIARHFPQAAHARITHRWGGPLAVPRDWTPCIELRRSDRYARLGGYVGDGVAATNLFARTLVDVYLDRDTPRRHLPFVHHQSPRWEVEPLRFLGINALIGLSNSIDTYEQRHGRTPRLRSRVLHALL